ncbi:MAG: hypothetical protein Kow00109_04360 [Acidobacteriota bacterium]
MTTLEALDYLRDLIIRLDERGELEALRRLLEGLERLVAELRDLLAEES